MTGRSTSEVNDEPARGDCADEGPAMTVCGDPPPKLVELAGALRVSVRWCSFLQGLDAGQRPVSAAGDDRVASSDRGP